MTTNSTTSRARQSEADTTVHLLGYWFDTIEAGLRDRVREFIQTMIESELEAALVRPRYRRRPKADVKNGNGLSGISGHRHGHRLRSLMGTFRTGRDRSAARQARHGGGQDIRVEKQGAASLSAADQTGRFADRQRLPWWDQHASGETVPASLAL
jgi:hypothetical protein